MSLIMAQVHKNHALLVTDTQACIDDRPVTDTMEKLHPLPRGFFASGSGPTWSGYLVPCAACFAEVGHEGSKPAEPHQPLDST